MRNVKAESSRKILN